MDFHHTVTSSKTVEQAAEAVEKALAERKFSVLCRLDSNEKLREKGLDLAPRFLTLEVCNAPKAKQVLETNIFMGYFLPCKVVVYDNGEGTRIGFPRPTMMAGALGDDRLEGVAREVEQILSEAIEASR